MAASLVVMEREPGRYAIADQRQQEAEAEKMGRVLKNELQNFQHNSPLVRRCLILLFLGIVLAAARESHLDLPLQFTAAI